MLSIEMTGVKDYSFYDDVWERRSRDKNYCVVVDGVKERGWLCFVMKRGYIPL